MDSVISSIRFSQVQICIERERGREWKMMNVPAARVFDKSAEEALPSVLQVRIDDAGVDTVCRDSLFGVTVVQGARVDDVGQF